MSGSRVCVKWSRAVSRFVIDCAQCVWEKGRDEGRDVLDALDGRMTISSLYNVPPSQDHLYTANRIHMSAPVRACIFLHEQWAIARDIRSEAILSVGGNSPNECLQHSIYDLVGKSTHAKI